MEARGCRFAGRVVEDDMIGWKMMMRGLGKVEVQVFSGEMKGRLRL